MLIDELPADLHAYVFTFLPIKQLFKIESINKKWRNCVCKSLDTRITFFKTRDLLYGKAFKKN